MKKNFILFVCAIMSVSLICCSCKNLGSDNKGSDNPSATQTPVPVYSLLPADILTSDNLNTIISYSPVCDNLKNEESEKAILYRSEPIGQGDTVKIEVRQYTNSVSKEDIKAKYDNDKSSRSSAEEITLDGGYEGFVAFPSVHIYHDGYYVSITAGSGNDDAQKQLLINTAELAVSNLKTLIGESTDAEAQTNDNSEVTDKPEITDKPTSTLSVVSLNDNK